MSLSLSVAAIDKPAPAQRTFLQKAELVCFLLIALNQVLGAFDPPEAFLFDPSVYSQDVGGGATRSYPFTTAISHFLEAFTIFLVLRHWKAYLSIIRRSWLVFLQVLIIVSSTMWSIGQTESLRSSAHYAIDYILALHFVYTYSAFEFAAALMRLSSVGLIASLVLLAAFPGISHEIAGGGYGGAWRGAYENKNYLGAITSISVVAAGFCLVTGSDSRRFAIFVMLADLILLIGSRSSTSLVAAAVCLALLCFIVGAQNPRAGLLTGSIALGGLCFLFAALTTVHDPFALLGKDSTLTGRTAVWHAVIPLIKQRPLLGYGLGFWDIDSDYRDGVWAAANWNAPHAHNDYLDIMLQTGLISLCVVVANYLICIYRGLRYMWRIQDGSVLFLMLVLNFMIRGLTETLTPSPATPQIALLYVAETYLWLLARPSPAPWAGDRSSAIGLSSRPLDPRRAQTRAG